MIRPTIMDYATLNEQDIYDWDFPGYQKALNEYIDYLEEKLGFTKWQIKETSKQSGAK